jgi:hypothetical protein
MLDLDPKAKERAGAVLHIDARHPLSLPIHFTHTPSPDPIPSGQHPNLIPNPHRHRSLDPPPSVRRLAEAPPPPLGPPVEAPLPLLGPPVEAPPPAQSTSHHGRRVMSDEGVEVALPDEGTGHTYHPIQKDGECGSATD